MLRSSRWLRDAAHEAAAKRQLDLLARRKGVYDKTFYFKVFGASFVGLCAYFPISFLWADCMEENGETFGTPTAVHLLESMPLHFISRCAGAMASSTVIPRWVHQRIIEAGVAFGGVDLNDIEPEEINRWHSVQDFFERKLKKDARPIDAEGYVTSPCDGQLLKCGLVDSDNKIVQVKGCSYTVQNLFRSTVTLPPALRDSTKRCYFAFRLNPHDYHRFHAPIAFQPLESVHVPGYLFPVMRAAIRWIPMLYVNNERIIVNGDIVPRQPPTANSKEANKHSAAAKILGKVSMAFVGATCVGGIHLNMDSRIKTNMLEPPPYALHRKYDRAVAPLVSQGEEVGHFSLGSAIVLIVDVPKDMAIVVSEGQSVRMGQALIKSLPSAPHATHM